ncbi:bifunctional indole-3-glycerol-phosphate synthase TrpC/phosphoribosylanthranilate isomerase TrpF [Rodentibacter pneumotropicus]|uniref:bifunctional indole-3-glycerol-phosphate synthase TrpC/phosphoribosylanthranilate isomerase TrpF n=1 Tax=Rodentibacter pneumotropicus TaxID=758 RepID=UPI00037DA797|nr:bifunctional indole-3-glycerol-phosphate synthase TrpC/phosphoribosylanthranilate isomerase TrpF [Rodentibacter pneumotropicus]MDC2824776.1 bifunctional indole-3-glycerol-phosphate synthase TrpC/phosphoribosylanthranilate isomerase TrpF [Rodentibacter pneumotropicus]NBH74793.1 bifunctional indole-3-glycerol-phosphate synthase TrpC/phosphoribosylanthranilate isomerase TrpF [Rodentibacter pneumotropicus]OOF62794.1 bifunctional indole-3-glycerol phosphate synthase/phosphoribosylanthranilate isom
MITQDFSKPINSATVLQKIVLDKAAWVKAKEAEFPLSAFHQNITKSDRSFYDTLSKGTHQKPAYILECKKASPSKGLIRAEFNLDEIANVYKHYASAVSVLTDEKYFQGDFEFLPQVRHIVSQPVLCKDFMISEYQVYLARYYQADAILLMLSVVNDETYQVLANLAHSLGMGVLTETSNEEEFERALSLGAKIIGVNNRNLHDLTVDLNRVVELTKKYADRIPADVRIISESGIYDHQQIRQLQKVAQGFLIGSSLMGSADLNNAVRAMIFGENKVCGLTRTQDVKTVYANGALYGGLIFAEKSKRCISLRQAQELVTAAPLRFVGVFQNQEIDFILKIAQQLRLYAVQLHGAETPEFIADLRRQLPETCQIWKALSIDTNEKSAVNFADDLNVARYIFDSQTANQQGGTGKTFDWSLIPEKLKYKTILAGGISPENIELATAQDCLGVDLNSGVESTHGVKDEAKVRSVFEKIFNAI